MGRPRHSVLGRVQSGCAHAAGAASPGTSVWSLVPEAQGQPPGHLLAWQPGRGSRWKGGTDPSLLLTLGGLPSGRAHPERAFPRVGRPPTPASPISWAGQAQNVIACQHNHLKRLPSQGHMPTPALLCGGVLPHLVGRLWGGGPTDMAARWPPLECPPALGQPLALPTLYGEARAMLASGLAHGQLAPQRDSMALLVAHRGLE